MEAEEFSGPFGCGCELSNWYGGGIAGKECIGLADSIHFVKDLPFQIESFVPQYTRTMTAVEW